MIDSRTIQITEGIFDGTEDFSALLKERLNIVYGANGSGKSTIARYFKTWQPADAPFKTYVFDEEYIQKNFRLHENSLHSVVMLGEENIKLSQERENLKESKKELEAKIEDLNKYIPEGEEKLQTYIEDIKNQLNSTLGYQKRYYTSIGQQNKRLLKEPNEIIQKIEEIAACRQMEFMGKEPINKLMNDLAAVSKSKLILYTPASLTHLKELLSQADELLEKTLKQPTLSDDDKHILEIAVNPDTTHYISETKELIEKHPSHCPLCHQPLSADYLQSLYSKIESVLDKETDEFKNQISTLADTLTQELPLCQEPIDSLGFDFDKLEDKYQLMVEKINGAAKKLQDKKNSLYKPMQKLSEEILQSVLQYEEQLNLLVKAVSKHNEDFEQKKVLEAEFDTQNKRMAYEENRADIDAYISLSETLQNAKEELPKLYKALQVTNSQLESSDTRAKDYTIAVDLLNQMLGFVFLSNRLQVELTDGNQYVIKNNGKDVPTKNLSTGEQNAIAMAYFFLETFKGKSDTEKYSQETLLVVDDPISSFDAGNKTGMTTLLNAQFSNILKGNQNSKVLIMTHDFQVAVMFHKSKRNIAPEGRTTDTDYEDEGDNNYNNPMDSEFLKLENKRLKPTCESRTEYYSMLNNIYFFGFKGSDQVSEYLIGNQIRRVLETFASFVLKSPAIIASDEIIQKVPNENDKAYFKHFNMWFALNLDSHKTPIEDITASFSTEEKRKFARAAIYYIYIISPRHIESYIKGKKLKTLLDKTSNKEQVI